MISCKKEDVDKNENSIQETESKKAKKDEIILIFPDTVLVNNSYSGEIHYKNDLDTITTHLYHDKKKYRYIKYAFTGTKTLDYDVEHLKTIIKDTAWATNNRIVPIKDIWFGKVGVYYFDGVIIDEVIIDDGTKNEKGQPLTRIITHEFRLSKKVVVVEKKKVNVAKISKV